MIYLGCSGWNYRDWVGKFYPSRTGDMLTEYSKKFNTVEINTSFYRVPPPAYVDGWIKKVSGRPGFTFSIKFPKEVTHDLFFKDRESAMEKSLEFEENIIRRLKRKSMLGCVLVQMPPYFSSRNAPALYRILESLDTSGIRYFVEVRHADLYENKEVRNSLESMNVGVVDIDSPLKSFRKIESGLDTAYVRFHGRNSEAWSRRSEDPSERYYYLYSSPELRNLSEIVKDRLGAYSDVFIYFNNHPSGFAPSNASDFGGMIGVPSQKEASQKRFIEDF